MSLDKLRKSRINLFDDCKENVIFSCWSQDFICCLCSLFIPVDNFIPPGAVIDDGSSVSMIESHWGHGSSVIFDIDDIEEIDTFGLDVIVLPDLCVDPLEGGAVAHDGGVVLGGDEVGDLTKERP